MNKKRVITTSDAPAAIGPYSQAVIYDQTIYCSGQIALDPVSGDLVGDDAGEQIERVMENVGKILEASGSEWDNVLKCTLYITDMGDFSLVNEVYGRYFPSAAPAREVVEVKALPKGAMVKLSCIAHQ